MIRDRVISGITGAAALIIVLLSNRFIIGVGVMIITLFIIYEIYKSFGFFKKLPLTITSLLFPFFVVFTHALSREFLMLVIFVYVFILFGALIFYHDQIELRDIIYMFAFNFIVTLFMAHISMLYELENGNVYIWMVFIGGFMTDTSAYFSGMLFGKHKLAPGISPKKTIEGAIGGVLGCCVSFLVFGFIVSLVVPGFHVSYPLFAGLGAVASVVAQMGDLAASCVKRENGIKDFGKIMPGHGGVLDRFDSILFVAPCVYYLVKYVISVM